MSEKTGNRRFDDDRILPVYQEPELIEIAQNQFDLSEESIEALSEIFDLQQDDTCRQLLKISHDLGGGLGPDGKQKWLLGKIDADYSLEQILEAAEKLKDSPAT